MIKHLSPSEAVANWETIAPMLQRVLDRFDYGSDIDDLLADVVSNKRFLWSISNLEGVAMLRVSSLPKFTTLDVDALAGDNMDKWLTPFIDQLTKYAKVLGCKYVDTSGRDGWVRQLKQFGFQKTSVDVRLKV